MTFPQAINKNIFLSRFGKVSISSDNRINLEDALSKNENFEIVK